MGGWVRKSGNGLRAPLLPYVLTSPTYSLFMLEIGSSQSPLSVDEINLLATYRYTHNMYHAVILLDY